MKFKKVICFGLAAVSVLGVTGCGGSRTIEGEDVSIVPEDTYELKWYMNATPQMDEEAVETEISNYLKDKLNIKLKLEMLDSAQYSKKLTTMIAASEPFDLAYCGAGTLDYASSIRNDALFDMAPYVDEYMPGLKASFEGDFLDSAYVDGMLGAIPINKELGAQMSWYYRKDIADKYGIDMTKYKSLDELEPVLTMIKEKEPSIDYPIDWDKSMNGQNTLLYTMPAIDCVILLDDGVPREEVKLFPETPEFQAVCKTARRFYEKGLVKPDVLTATDTAERLKNGQTFCIIRSAKPGGVQEAFGDAKYPIASAAFAPVTQNSPKDSMIGLSSSSENPYRAMRFLDLLYTDPVLSNMVVYGLEGKHYKTIGEDTIELLPDSKYDLSESQWMLGNVFLNHLTVKDLPEKKELYKEFNKEIVPNKAQGFYPLLEGDMEQKRIAVQAVKEQYRAQAVTGALDPEKVLPEYIAKLKEAGGEELVAEIQRQYTEYLKSER